MRHGQERLRATDAERRELLKALGVVGTAGIVGDVTLSEVRGEVAAAGSAELASMGQALRSDLSGTVDTALLAGGMAGVASSIERLPELAAAGLPEEVGTAYEELTEPAWEIHDHLLELGFFESAGDHLPPFVPDHIESTARELVGAGTLSGVLADVGFSEEELTALAADVVANDAHLAKWKPANAYPPGAVEDFDPADVAPLHQRATEGALLWIDGLDWWLWQNRVLLTEELLADGIADIKAMLGGYYLMSQAAHDVGEGSVSDEQLAAMTTAGTAIAILAQENLAFDLIRVTDDMRAPREGGV